jgi:CCR4-NOT transcriptional complex subunit CAF120
MDPRDERTSVVRGRLIGILLEKMRAVPPSLPPIPTSPDKENSEQQQQQQQNGQAAGAAPTLPSLNFGTNRDRGTLTPITERTLESVDLKQTRSTSGDRNTPHAPPSTVAEESLSEHSSALGMPITKSSSPAAPNTGGTSTASGYTSPKKVTSKYGDTTSSDSPPKAGSALSQSGKSSSPAASPKVSLEQPQPKTTSPAQHPKSPPQPVHIKPVDPSSSSHPVLTNPHSPSTETQVSPASRYSQASPGAGTSSPAQFPTSPGHTEPPLSGQSQYSDTPRPQKNQDLPSIASNIQEAQKKLRNPGPFPSTPSEASGQSLFDEAGALYYMQQFEAEGQNRRIPTTISEGTDESQSSNDFAPRERSAAGQAASVQRGTPDLLNRQMTAASVASSGLGMDPTLPPAAKQSGARAVPSHQKITNQNRDDDADSSSSTDHPTAMADRQQDALHMSGDDNSDALAALSFLAQEISPVKPIATPKPRPPPSNMRAPSPAVDSEATTPLRSSFAPSKQAAERKARVQAQEAASHAAAHKPGRPNGNRKNVNGDKSGWHQSSDEEEEEEEDDDDGDSDEAHHRGPPAPIPVAPVQPLHPRGRDISPTGPHSSMVDPNARAQQRQSRTLPPVPVTRPGELQNSLEWMTLLIYDNRWL